MGIIPGFNHLNHCCIFISREVWFPVCATTAWRIYMAGEFMWQVDSGFKRYRCRFWNGIQGIVFLLSANKSLTQNTKNPGSEHQMCVNLERGPKEAVEILSISPGRRSGCQRVLGWWHNTQLITSPWYAERSVLVTASFPRPSSSPAVARSQMNVPSLLWRAPPVLNAITDEGPSGPGECFPDRYLSAPVWRTWATRWSCRFARMVNIVRAHMYEHLCPEWWRWTPWNPPSPTHTHRCRGL